MQAQPDGGPLAWTALDGHRFANRLGAALHVAQAIPPPASVHVKALAVVLHHDLQCVRRRLGPNVDLVRSGVFQGIGQRLFDHQKHVMPHFRRQRQRRQIVRQIQPAMNGAPFE